ncbi:ATP-binding protein [Streptomyces sp. PT12]|uniref:ATP-binding protein n=1 Tax=Streptomyces sp. PT12 TaxID=1510197 RepID=UPI000DE35505|nr:ATP-binding protein [Streptomyces sp. PT12]RBM16659.1 ATP-binding protein [Streptomyces sp. PT12]
MTRPASAVLTHGHLRFRLPAVDTSAAEARRLTRRQLRQWRAPVEACDNAQLVISELVTNALRHTESESVGCELRILGPLLRVAVASDGMGPRHAPRQAGEDEEGGRGLLLVCALATVWGVRPREAEPGHVVWADLPLDGTKV